MVVVDGRLLDLGLCFGQENGIMIKLRRFAFLYS